MAPLAMMMVATASLVVAGVTVASRGTRVSFEFTPDAVPRHVYAPGAIDIHLRTAVPHRTRASRIRFDFDDHFRFAPDAASSCDREAISNSQVDMAAAMERCGSANIGSGTARATDGTTTLTPCVLVFNGSPEGGLPTILLFVRVRLSPPIADCSDPSSNHSGNVSLLIRGFLEPSRLHGYGKMFRFNRLNGAEPFPLTNLDLTIQRGDYVSARCSREDSRRGWRLRAKVGYVKPRSVQVAESTRRCIRLNETG